MFTGKICHLEKMVPTMSQIQLSKNGQGKSKREILLLNSFLYSYTTLRQLQHFVFKHLSSSLEISVSQGQNKQSRQPDYQMLAHFYLFFFFSFGLTNIFRQSSENGLQWRMQRKHSDLFSVCKTFRLLPASLVIQSYLSLTY